MAYDYSLYGGVLVARQDVARQDKVLTITLNSPETPNAFTGPQLDVPHLGRCERRS